MTITTVKTQEYGYLVNGNMSVPNDLANRDYQDILDWVNEGNAPEGPDVIEPDYVALRTGPNGYASTGEQLGMQTDGTWDAHVADVKTRFPKTITGGTTIGDVPQDILDAAAAKLAAYQLAKYNTAVARLAMYVLSEGRAEVTETRAGWEQVYNEETEQMEDVMQEFITASAIAPLDATVEVTTYDVETDTSTTATVANPLITKDDEERAAAQAIVDAYPT
jgi:hypothetical protein